MHNGSSYAAIVPSSSICSVLFAYVSMKDALVGGVGRGKTEWKNLRLIGYAGHFIKHSKNLKLAFISDLA